MTTIKLLTNHPDYAALPAGQAATYRLLLELGTGQYCLTDLVQQSQLRSPLPFWSRLRHLEQRGLIALTETEGSEGSPREQA